MSRSAFATVFLVLVCPMAAAQSRPDAVERMAQFRYDQNGAYAILCRPGAPTDIELAPEEHVVGFALGDTVQWVVEELPGHVFVKPLKANLATAGTLVTNRRTYQLSLRSVSADAAWHQRVSWIYPDLVVLRDRAREPSAPAPTSAPEPPQTGRRAVDPASLRFSYEITGDPSLRPLQVFDDGRFTWLRMRSTGQLPAVFALGPDGAEVVNYSTQGDYLLVHRVMQAAVIKLGRAEARIVNKAKPESEPARERGRSDE